MEKIQLFTFYKNPKVILVLILVVFFLKGVFLAIVFPIFTGQDEARHYNSIQFLLEPEDKAWDKNINNWKQNKDDLATYRFSEEIQKTSTAADVDILRGDLFNTVVFSDSFDGKNEAEINSGIWKPINYVQPDAVTSTILYHKVASSIEKTFANQNILVRFYLIRIFSVLLGTLAIFLAYLIAKTIGFSAKHSLILTAIIAFQPKFTMYFTNINYDALLIPMFFLFTLAGVRTLKEGLDWKNIVLFLFSIGVAIQTKSTGYLLIIIFLALAAYLLYEKVKLRNKRFRYEVYGACFFIFVFVVFYLYNHFFADNGFGKAIGSASDYISKTITFKKFILPSGTYWGSLSWVNSFLLNNATNFIFIVETLALVGLGLLLFSKKPYPAFLPAKKYVLFLVGMIVALQLGVRIADWNVFSEIGGMQMSLGTPGRYFLPNLAAHIILVFTGLGTLLAYYKKEKYFDYVLKTGLILMFAFMMYLVFDTIILRFYL